MRIAPKLDLQFLEDRVLYNGTLLSAEALSSIEPVDIDPQQSADTLVDGSPVANLGELKTVGGPDGYSDTDSSLDGIDALMEQLSELDVAFATESQVGGGTETEADLASVASEQTDAQPFGPELIIVDGGLSDQQTLSAILHGGLAVDRAFEVIVLDRSVNGVDAITQFLGSSDHQYSAIHLVTHGIAGGLQLGGVWLNESNLASNADELQQWRGSLLETADVLIYGCYVAEGQEAQQWLTELARLLQVDIQASTDLTGSSQLGGDWEVEFAVGQIETSQIFTADWIDSMNWVLDVNQAPGLITSANPTLGSVLEGATDPAGVTVAGMVVDWSIFDYDGPAVEAIAIIGLNTSMGTWQYSLNDGTSGLTIQADLINNQTNEMALLLGPTAQLRLIPFGDLNGSVSDAITFRAWDMTSGSEGQYTVITATGSWWAFSQDSDTAAVTVTAVNDAPTFLSGDGVVTTAIGSGSAYLSGVTMQADGKLVVGGQAWNGSNWDFALVRYNANGSLDTSFGTGGKVTTAIGAGNEDGQSVTIQPDGKIVIGGYARIGSTDDFALVRYNADGTLDTSFGSGGIVTTAFGTDLDQGRSVTIQPDGKIVLGGGATIGGAEDFALVRYNANGSLDTSFGSGGKVIIDIGWDDDSARSVTIQSDGKIVAGGAAWIGSATDFALVRYNADGSLDTRFDLANSLGGSVSYDRGSSPVVLDSNVQIFDAELSSTNFSGTTLTLVRNGGASAQDLFSATGTLGALIQGGDLVVGGTTIGTVTTNSGGTLVLTFSSSATNTLVKSAMQQIAYANNTGSGSVQINWTFSDGNSSAQGTGGALTATGNVVVVITSSNNPPVANNDTFTTSEDTSVTFDVRSNDSDPESNPLSVTQINGAAISVGGSVAVNSGSVTLNANGTLTFTPTANYNGSPSFTYTLSDGSLTATATVNGTVTAVNDAPVLDTAANQRWASSSKERRTRAG